jgi:hypothetical protein
MKSKPLKWRPNPNGSSGSSVAPMGGRRHYCTHKNLSDGRWTVSTLYRGASSYAVGEAATQGEAKALAQRLYDTRRSRVPDQQTENQQCLKWMDNGFGQWTAEGVAGQYTIACSQLDQGGPTYYQAQHLGLKAGFRLFGRLLEPRQNTLEDAKVQAQADNGRQRRR